MQHKHTKSKQKDVRYEMIRANELPVLLTCLIDALCV